MINLTEYPFIFSPSFSKYIDMDERHTKFIIRNAHERKIMDIPEELMSTKEEEMADVVRRFRWISETRIHIISHDGIERIIDIEDNFKEIAFNFIPLYDATICQKHHYMFDPPSFNLDQNL
jgi:hypothetical protein